MYSILVKRSGAFCINESQVLKESPFYRVVTKHLHLNNLNAEFFEHYKY